MIVDCDCCGKKIRRKPYQLKKFNHKFCTKECYNKWMKETGPRGKEHPLYRKMEIKCEQCGALKLKERKHYKKRKHHFCSQECYVQWEVEKNSGENNPRYNRIKVNCDSCGKVIEILNCKIKEYNYHFCNSKCFGDWKSKNWSGENSVFWKDGISFEPYSTEFNNKLKEYVRIRDNFTCKLCEIPENGEAHSCHHIDYDKKNTNPKNLILLCRACNSKVNHNREQWIDYFKGMLCEKNY